MRIAWVTDIHLNFLDGQDAEAFLEFVDQYDAEAVLVGGDFNTSNTLAALTAHLTELIEPCIAITTISRLNLCAHR